MKKLLLIGFIFLIGCAVAPIQPSSPMFLQFNQPYDIAWKAAVKVLTIDNGLPMQMVEKDSGILATDWVIYERPFKGGAEAFMISSVPTTNPNLIFRYKININIEEVEDGIKITIRRNVEMFEGLAWYASNERPAILDNIKSDLINRLQK